MLAMKQSHVVDKLTSPDTFPLLPDDKPEILHHPFDILNILLSSSASGFEISVGGEEARRGR